MNENTVYIMSGIIDVRLDDVLSALPESINVVERYEDKGWYCLVAVKQA